MDIRFSGITSMSYVDGPGCRAVLHLQGCSIRCKGCQNPHLWPTDGGQVAPTREVAAILVETGLDITVTGGEPFDQPRALSDLLREIRSLDANRHIIVYSGYTFGALIKGGVVDVLLALSNVDVLVDGPYVHELDTPGMQYRGSSNQRPIDTAATFRRPVAEMLHNPILLDWDTPEIIITEDGDLLGASPLIAAFADIGTVCSARRCGED